MSSQRRSPAGAEAAGLGNVHYQANVRLNATPHIRPQVAIADSAGIIIAVVNGAAAARSYLREVRP